MSRFNNYDKIIKNNKYNMLDLIIYYSLTCNDLFKDLKLNDNDLDYLIDFIYNTYLKDEQHTDLSYICDKALENVESILKNRTDSYKHFTTYDLLESCYWF
mgnify:CR=1 FL=1